MPRTCFDLYFKWIATSIFLEKEQIGGGEVPETRWCCCFVGTVELWGGVACVYLLRGVWTHICQAASGARRHLFSACGELTNTQEEASKLVYVGLVVAEAQPDACPVGSSGTPPLTFVGVIEHGGSTLCLLVHKHRPSFLLIVCVSVCVCVTWSLGPTLTQSASAIVPEGVDGGAARALPCPPNTRSC